MPSIPSSPSSPRRRRKASVDLAFTTSSPHPNANNSRRSSVNRRGSQYSIEIPLTPRLALSQDSLGSNAVSSAADANHSTGLGNLADELAEAWDEEDGERGESLEAQLSQADRYTNGLSSHEYHSDLGIYIPQVQSSAPSNISLSPPKQSSQTKHRRVNSQYDGSDYGDESDLENTSGISPGLESRMAAVESLARRGSESNGSDQDDVVRRVAESLKDLPSQSVVENGITRLITSHSALSSHLANQTRLVLSLSHPLTSPLSIPPEPSTIDELLSLLSDLLLALPTPSLQCLTASHTLHTSTRDLQTTLTQLNDTVYMIRQTSTQASRKLRTTSDMVSEMRREAEAREEGVRWIERGGWDARLKDRECARVCREVVGGFEEVCNGWRERIAGGGLEVGAA